MKISKIVAGVLLALSIIARSWRILSVDLQRNCVISCGWSRLYQTRENGQ